MTPTVVQLPPSGIETVWVVDPAGLSAPEQTLAATLQGLVASGRAVIWMVDPGMDALLLAGLEEEGVELRDADFVWQLVAEFRDQLQGAVLYDLGTDSINVATSLCGPMQAVAVDTSLLAAEEDAGLPILTDVRGYEDYSSHNAKDGRVFLYEGKPGVCYRNLLWDPVRANSPEGVTEAVAQLPADPQHDPDSYALINVHAWSFKDLGGPMEAVKQAVDLLPRKTRVVTAEESFILLRENFGPPVVQD